MNKKKRVPRPLLFTPPSGDPPKMQNQQVPEAKYLLAVPAMDWKLDTAVVGSILTTLAVMGAGMRFYVLNGNSNIAEARNRIAHYFLRHTPCEVLLCLDADIIYTLDDLNFLLEGSEEVVIAPYSRKQFDKPPTDWGMGFCRIHRNVFQKLADWTVDGQEALGRYYSDGEIAVDYYKTGATVDSRWFGEDTGFWHYCAMNNISLRQEKRTRLGHVGRFVYGYPKTPGILLESDGAQ